MPALLLIGIPIIVMVLFLGIMSLPDDEPKDTVEDDADEPEPVTRLVKKSSKSKKKKR